MSEPTAPRIAKDVGVESYLTGPLLLGLIGTLLWNWVIAPDLGLATVSVFAGVAGAYLIRYGALVVGYAVGQGVARQNIAEQEVYAEQAATFLAAIDEAHNLEDEERAAGARGGQG